MIAAEKDLRTFYAQRLQVQGPDHPEVVRALATVLKACLRTDDRSHQQDPLAGPVPAELPCGVGFESVRLEGEHAELLADVLVMAVELQERETQAFGPDDPRALIATVFLAQALAAADQLDGQLDAARVLVEDARDGLAEAGGVSPADRDIAEVVHHWVLDLLGEDPSY